MQSYINWTAIDAIAEVCSCLCIIPTTVLMILSIIILVCQNRREGKQHKESTIRTEWYILDAERQTLKPDVDKLDGKHADERYSESEDRYIAIINQMHKLYDKYPDILSDWPRPPETFQHFLQDPGKSTS